METQTTAVSKQYPIYNESKPTKPGMYLGLFHGRKFKTQDMNDWGSNGPLIGPIKWCHTTYQFHIRIRFSDEAGFDWRDKYGFKNSEPEILTDPKTGLVKFDGTYYGDWTVFYHDGK